MEKRFAFESDSCTSGAFSAEDISPMVTYFVLVARFTPLEPLLIINAGSYRFSKNTYGKIQKEFRQRAIEFSSNWECPVWIGTQKTKIIGLYYFLRGRHLERIIQKTTSALLPPWKKRSSFDQRSLQDFLKKIIVPLGWTMAKPPCLFLGPLFPAE